jgi:hypothetical protein
MPCAFFSAAQMQHTTPQIQMQISMSQRCQKFSFPISIFAPTDAANLDAALTDKRRFNFSAKPCHYLPAQG